MGGGKTHLLVGFGLLAKHPDLRKKYCGGDLMAQCLGVAKIAAFNGRNNPEQFFWGEIANQLGKGEQFKAFWMAARRPPTRRTGLSCSRAASPSLSCSTRCRRTSITWTRRRWRNGTVADIATRAFANLLTAAGKKNNVCVVVSDLAATYDTGTKLINRAPRRCSAGVGPPGAQHHARGPCLQ